MPIRYASGTYSTPLTLLTAMDTYLVSVLGWTQNMAPTLIAGKTVSYRAHYQKSITKNGETTTVYWNMATQGNSTENIFTTTAWIAPSANSIGMYGYCSTGYNAGSNWDAQAGIALTLTNLRGIVSFVNIPAAGSGLAYNFYGNQYGDFYITTQYNPASNMRQFMTCGILEKAGYGTWAGGTFYGASLSLIEYSTSISNFGGQQVVNECIPGLHYASNGSACMIYGTVDGVTGWITIPIQPSHIVVGGYANYTTNRVGRSNLVGSPIDPNNLPQSGAMEGVFGAYGIEGSIASPSGIIYGQDIEFYVLRASGRVSPLGLLPLIKLCQAMMSYGLPWHYQAIDSSWQLENNVMISLVDA